MIAHPAPNDPNTESFEDRIRRVDADRWLASRFIGDPEARATVVAIYALNDELSRIGPSVSQPLAGEIRLAWWRERIEAMASGEPSPSQPVLQALSPAIRAGRLPAAALDALIEARHADLDARPFADDAGLARYLDGVSGAVMGLAGRAIDAEAPLRAVVEAGRAWGLAGLFRNREAWRVRGRSWVPASWGEPPDAELAARVAAETDGAVARAREELQALPVAAFPAVAYATLAQPHAHGRTPGELERRARLLKAVLTGRI